MGSSRPVGDITRGTTGPNRLRRCDRWLTATHRSLLRSGAPVVVDLGYGASPVTTVELHSRLTTLNPRVQVIGIEIDPARVSVALPLERPGLRFALGGFELPVPGALSVVRAFNVLRQYDESQVPDAWARVCGRLAEGGVFIDGTCDEIGRLATWVALSSEGPRSLTLSWRLAGLADPAVIAERLPKALIHHNVPGEAIHEFLTTLSRQWAHASPHSAYGVRQRFLATARAVAADWPLLDDEKRWRLGELTVAWDAVRPG